MVIEALDDKLHVSDRLMKSLGGSYLTASINPPWIKLYMYIQNAFLTHKILMSRDNRPFATNDHMIH